MTPFEETSPQKLHKSLQKFYLSPRKSDDRIFSFGVYGRFI